MDATKDGLEPLPLSGTARCASRGQYRRIASRRGPKRAVLAVAHTIAVIIYHILRDHTTYQDLRGSYFDERDRQATEKRLVRRLQRLGYQVELHPLPQTG